jgi:FixJ family two-component response regulator
VESWGWEAQTFSSADEFLSVWSPTHEGCLILDVRLPGMSGLELQERLVAQGIRLPIIFITAHGDRQAEARGRQAGAIAFLYKPFERSSPDGARPLLPRSRTFRMSLRTPMGRVWQLSPGA